MISRTLPVCCQYVAIIVNGRQRLATFSNCLKKLPSVAMVSTLWMSCQRVASESPTVVTVLQEVANTSPPGYQCFTQLCHNRWQLSGDHWRPFATWWKCSGNFGISVTTVGNSVETIGDHCLHGKMILYQFSECNRNWYCVKPKCHIYLSYAYCSFKLNNLLI